MKARAVRTEEFVEHLARKTSPRKDKRLFGDLCERDLRAMGKWVSRADHEAQAVFVNVVHLQIRGFDRQGDDAHVGGAVLHALQDLVAEVAVNTDVHQRIAALKFRKNIRKQVEARRFIGAKNDWALNHVAAVRDDLNGFVTQAKQLFRELEKDFAGRSQFHGLGGAVEQPSLVCLLELANLRANSGLRAEDLLARA